MAQTIKFRTSGKADPAKCLRRVASKWYDDDGGSLDDGKDGSYYFNAGEVACHGGEYQEISESTFHELHLLTEM